MYSGLYCVFFVGIFSSPFVLVYHNTPLVYFCSIDPKHEKILKAYRAKKEAFEKRYGMDKYDCCYNVFGEVMNQAYLDEITQAAEYRQRSYYESSNSNYSYSFNSFTNPTYTSEEKERLKRFYKSLSKLYHPDVNHDPNAHGDMVLLNRLKEEWGI